MQYYESLLDEKELMLQKAAQVIEGLRRDFQSLLIEYEKCKNDKEAVINQCQNWDQIQQIELLKKILNQESVTFHHEQLKMPFLHFNYKNELEIALIRENKLKQFLNLTQQQIQLIFDTFTQCIDEPIFQGVQQILFEFELWQNTKQSNEKFYSEISDFQASIYSQQIFEYKTFSKLYQNQFEDNISDVVNEIVQNLIVNEQVLQQQVKDNSELILRLIQQVKERDLEVQILRKELDEKNKQLPILLEINQNLEIEKQQLSIINQQLTSQQKKNEEQIMEYLQMIDEYEKIFSDKVDVEDYNKVEQLFEQSLQDLENLQNKYEKNELVTIDLKKQLKVQKNKMNQILSEIKSNVQRVTTNDLKCREVLSNIGMICDKAEGKVQNQNNVNHNQLLLQLTKQIREQQINNQQISIKKNHSKSFIN